MIIRKYNFLIGIGFVIFCFFVFTVDFRTNLFRSIYIAYAFAITSILLLYIGTHCKLTEKFSLPILFWFLSTFFVFTSADISLIIKYIIGLSLMYCYASKKGAKDYTIYVLAIVGCIFTFFTFLFYTFPNLYIERVVPWLEEYLQSSAVIMINTNRYPGLTGHYSTNGTYLAIGMGALFALTLTKKEHEKIKWFVLSVLTFAALLLIGKRAHLVFSAASCFAVYWIVNKNKKKNHLFKVMGFLIIIAVVFVIAVNQIPALGNTMNRFVETAEGDDFLMSRGIFYAKAWEEFISNPVLGCGWRTLTNIIGHDAHNIYIQLLAETGFVGFLFFTGLIIYSIAIVIKDINKIVQSNSRYSVQDKMMVYFSTYYLIFFAIYGMTGNPLYDEQPFYIFMISCGISLYYKRKTISSKISLAETVK